MITDCIEEAGHYAGRAVLESHGKYIDIQFVIEGTDMIGERPLSWNPVSGSRFALYFPGDAHAPLGGTGRLHRAIMKVGL